MLTLVFKVVFCRVVTFLLWSRFMVMALFLGLLVFGQASFAQSYGGRTAVVEVAPATKEILSIMTDVQGRVVAGPATAITAVTNAVTEMSALKLGDQVTLGQVIATQNSATLRRELDLLKIRLGDAQIRLEQVVQEDADETDRQQRRRQTLLLERADAERMLVELGDDLGHEASLLLVNQKQFELLRGKAQRAEMLSARSALSADAVETALSASLNAQQQVLVREATITRKTAQLAQAKSALERTILDLAQLDQDLAARDDYQQSRIKNEIQQFRVDIKNLQQDIKDTTLTAPMAGQLVFLPPLQRSYNREGDVVARIVNPENVEVEAEIPIAQMRFLLAAPKVEAVDLQGGILHLRPRAVLPVQNARTGTQAVRFSVIDDMPESSMADNTVIVLKVPTTSPIPVVTVPKDAVLPIVGGHIVYVAQDGIAVKTTIQLGEAVGNGFVVLGGLTAGQSVIVRGNEALTDGKKIKIGGGEAADRPKGPSGEAWTLNWTTQRGPASGDLILGAQKSFFNGEEVAVVRAGDSINFIGKLFLPFGVVDLEFQGTISDAAMAGKVTLRGLPGGREPVLDFTGTKAGQ